MPDLLNFSLCNAASLDTFTGKVSLFFLWDSLQPMGLVQPEENAAADNPPSDFGLMLGSVMLVAQWWRRDDDGGREFDQRITLISPDGREATLQPSLRFAMSRPFQRIFHQVPMLAVRMPGVFRARIELRVADDEWEMRAEYPFIVEEVSKSLLPSEPIGTDDSSAVGLAAASSS